MQVSREAAVCLHYESSNRWPYPIHHQLPLDSAQITIIVGFPSVLFHYLSPIVERHRLISPVILCKFRHTHRNLHLSIVCNNGKGNCYQEVSSKRSGYQRIHNSFAQEGFWNVSLLSNYFGLFDWAGLDEPAVCNFSCGLSILSKFCSACMHQ